MRKSMSKVAFAAMLVSLPAWFAAADARATAECGYGDSLPMNGVGVTNPALASCVLNQPVYTGPGSAFLTQDISSNIANTYALSATSLNNTAIYAYSGANGYAVLGSAANADGGHFTNNSSGSSAVAGINSGDGNGVFGKGEGSTSTGVYGTGGSYGVYGTGSNGVYGTGSVVGVEAYSSSGYALVATSGSSGVAGYFTGPVTVDGVLTVNSCMGCSDRRLKKNIRPLGEGAINQLLKLKPVAFEWIDPAGNHHEKETGTVLGFIAQDVQELFPEWVDEKGYTAKDGQTYRTLDLRQIEALEVESIRVLKDRADKADARADKAEKDLKAVKADTADRLDRLEGLTNLPKAGFGYGYGGWGVAAVLGVALSAVLADRKKNERKS